MFKYFPSSLTLPWSEELRWDCIKCYTISPSEIRNLFQKQYQVDLQHLQMGWSDWCYWDVSVVTSLVLFVLHELHPDDILFNGILTMNHLKRQYHLDVAHAAQTVQVM